MLKKNVMIIAFMMASVISFAQVNSSNPQAMVNQAKAFDGIQSLKNTADKVNAAYVQVKNSAAASRAKATEAQNNFNEACALYVAELKNQLKNYSSDNSVYKSITEELKTVSALQGNSTK
ncbi:MAG: hypothetical protein ACXVPN_13125 [Bacteroidia bacterium]